jgi:rhodanese-related sulfurtransferase
MSFFGNLFGGGQSNEKLASLIHDGAFLVDVRSPGEFAGGSVKGAANIPLDFITRQIKKFEGKKNIVVFCRSGNRSGQAKRILEEKGFKNVTNGGTWEQVSEIAENQF